MRGGLFCWLRWGSLFALSMTLFACGGGGRAIEPAETAAAYLSAIYPGSPAASQEQALAEARTKFFYYPEVPAAVFSQGIDPQRQDTTFAGWPPVPGGFLYLRGPLGGIPTGYPVEGIADDTWVEVGHVGSDDVAYWMLWVPGSGIFWNLGETLTGLNKTDTLKRLGLTTEQIVSLWNQAYAPDGRTFTAAEIEACSPPQNRWPEAVLDPDFCGFDAGGTDYEVIDDALITQATAAGLQSLQIVKSWTGEWLYQLVDVSGPSTVCGSGAFRVGRTQAQACTCKPSVGHLNCAEIQYSR